MMNSVHKLKYILMNKLGIKANPYYHTDCGILLRDDFQTLEYWAATFPATVTTSRSNGVTLSMQIANKKGYVAPTIISYGSIIYGNVTAVFTPNPYPKLSNNFTLRNHNMEWGFKIIGQKVIILFPMGQKECKLFQPTNQHKFNIDFDAKTNKIYWRIDDIIVYEMEDNVTVNKHVTISLHSSGPKFVSKELPQTLSIKSVNIYSYNIDNETQK